MRQLFMVSLIGSGMAFASPPEARTWQAADGMILKYRYSSPERIEVGKTYPLVLFLHGAGERGDDNEAQLKHGVIPVIKLAEESDAPCFLIAPQCPEGQWWSPIDRETTGLSAAGKPNALLEAVLALVEQTMKDQPIDPQRFYVTGISMGGFGTWDLLGRVPEKIAAALPICGGGDPALVSRFKDVPIWVFHGEADPTVPAKASRNMIAALEQAGVKPKASFYPGVQHDSWTQTYANPEVIRWMFAQRRK